MDDLAQWLRAQLDEDERIARAAGGLAWLQPEDPWEFAVAIRDSEGERVVCNEGWPSEGQQVHIVEWDPARVLREIEAKRRILDEVVPEMDGMTTQIHSEWGVGPMDPSTYESLALLRLLALPYADRPGYQEEWRP